jgi:glycosyltransferase involved in cell wall biosynthesis
VIHDIAPIVHPEYFSIWYQQFAQRILPRLARKVRAISTVSNHSKREICEKLNISSKKVNVVGAASALIHVNRTTSDFLEKKYRSEYMIFLGGHDPRKNLSFLLSIWPEIYKESGLKLYITSNGISPIFEKQTFSELQGVRLIDYPDDIQLATYIKNAACLLSPSIYEGFGMPVIEALSLATPVIATDTGIVKDIRCAGLKVIPLDRQVWKNAILEHRKILFEFEWNSWRDVSDKVSEAIAHVS